MGNYPSLGRVDPLISLDCILGGGNPQAKPNNITLVPSQPRPTQGPCSIGSPGAPCRGRGGCMTQSCEAASPQGAATILKLRFFHPVD
eukprot:9472098-Pyramimonas_sp.AAC.2